LLNRCLEAQFFPNIFIASVKKQNKGIQVKRQEAVEVLREILRSCNLLNPSYVSLHPLQQEDEYELQIKNQIADSHWNTLKDIVQKHGLAMQEYDGFLIIYTPEYMSK
jgi:hypothetical protein